MSAAEPVKQDNAKPRRSRLPTFFAFVLTIAGVWLGGQFVTQGLSDYFVDNEPGLAVLWRGDSPDALTRFAAQMLAVRRYQLAERFAAKALQLAPLDATAISDYGLAVDGEGRTDQADRVLTVASQRSWRDAPTQIWLLRRRLLQGRYAEGFEHIDALLRQEERYPPLPLAIMAAAGLDPKAVQPLAERLAYAPRWRLPFFVFLANAPRTDMADEEGQLLTLLAAGPTPPTDDELGLYLNRLLIRDARYQDAVAAWRRLSPPGYISPGLVNDGDFERPPRQTPFDWQLASGVGWTAQVADAPGDGHGKALSVDYDGVSPPQLLRQFIVLAPGAYHFSAMGYDQSGQGADTMSWRIACQGLPDALGSAALPPGPPNEWRAFGIDFTVPASGCPVQSVSLTATPSDVHKDLEVWYDNVAIVPNAAPVAPSAQSSGAPQEPR